MATWPPPPFPQLPLRGSSGGFGEGRLISPMESGPAKYRQRFTATFDPRAASILLTGSELATFQAFYKDTLAGGALSFDWADPTGDTQLEFQFTTPPTWEEVRPGATAAARLYRVNLPLETVPQ